MTPNKYKLLSDLERRAEKYEDSYLPADVAVEWETELLKERQAQTRPLLTDLNEALEVLKEAHGQIDYKVKNTPDALTATELHVHHLLGALLSKHYGEGE